MNRVVCLLFIFAACASIATQQVIVKPAPPSAHARSVNKTSEGYVWVNKKRTLVRYGDGFSAGTILKCTEKGSLEICYVNDDMAYLDWRSQPYQVRKVAGSEGMTWVPAGRKLSAGGKIFSPPANDGVVWPDRLVIRWVPIEGRVKLALFTVGDSQNALWRGEADGKAGRLVDKDARQKLEEIRLRDPGAMLELVLFTATEEEFRATFEILSKEAEKEVLKELGSAADMKGMQRLLAECEIFTNARLFSEAADRAEDALRLEPQSTALKYHVIFAKRRSGNPDAEVKAAAWFKGALPKIGSRG